MYLRRWPIRELKLFGAQLRKEDKAAVESTGTTRLFHDAVAEHVALMAVVNQNQFKVISQSVKKTDKNEAELLALYLAKRALAGGADEGTKAKRDEPSGSNARFAGQAAVGLEGQDQQHAFSRRDQPKAGVAQ